MSEKLKATSDEGEQHEKELRFPEDPDQYSEEELLADPAKRFHVNPDDFPIFRDQAEMGDKRGDPAVTLPIDETVGRFVKCTADCIAVLSGEDTSKSTEKPPAADHVIYLDKSARPVCWLNNVFWDAFTEKPRPEHSFLAIDRIEWFNYKGTEVNKAGYVVDENGKSLHLATFSDFKTENVTREDLARIRALYIPGGIENEDVETIMNTPTGLEGKNITVIDEVERSGSTLDIATYLISRAIPEAASVNGYTYWDAPTQDAGGGERQICSVPVWYNANDSSGRGIGDVNEPFFAKRHEKFQTPKTRAQKFGAFVLGSFVNLSEEKSNNSRQLAKEIKIMRKEWDDGHILMPSPKHYDNKKWRERVEKQNISLKPIPKDIPRWRVPKNLYSMILHDIWKRPNYLGGKKL